MIFATLGTHEQPFERALDLLLPLAAHEGLVIQHGHTPPRRHMAGVRWLEFLSPADVMRIARRADVIVCHAGVGSIQTALGAGHVPVVIPRLRAKGEHVDDHQLQIADALAAGGIVVACADGDSVELAVSEARRLSRATPAPHATELADAVSEAVGTLA